MSWLSVYQLRIYTQPSPQTSTSATSTAAFAINTNDIATSCRWSTAPWNKKHAHHRNTPANPFFFFFVDPLQRLDFNRLLYGHRQVHLQRSFWHRPYLAPFNRFSVILSYTYTFRTLTLLLSAHLFTYWLYLGVFHSGVEILDKGSTLQFRA